MGHTDFMGRGSRQSLVTQWHTELKCVLITYEKWCGSHRDSENTKLNSLIFQTTEIHLLEKSSETVWLEPCYQGTHIVLVKNLLAYWPVLLALSVKLDRIIAPCNYCHHPWCVGDNSYHKALLIMFSCDGMSDHASWSEVFHYWDTRLSWCFTV